MSELRKLWVEYESGDLDNHFPNYNIWTIELDGSGKETDRYILDLISGVKTDNKSLRFELDAPFEGRLDIYRFGDLTNPLPDNQIVLNPGGNTLGFYVKGKEKGEFWWAGFDWVNMSLEEKEVEAPAFAESDCGSFEFGVKSTETTCSGIAEDILKCHYEVCGTGSCSPIDMTIRLSHNLEDDLQYCQSVSVQVSGDDVVLEDNRTSDRYAFLSKSGSGFYRGFRYMVYQGCVIELSTAPIHESQLSMSLAQALDTLEGYAKSVIDR